TYYGGDHWDYVHHCAADDDGSIYIGGQSGSDDLATPGVWIEVNYDGYDGFLSKWTADGERIWCTYICGDGSDNLNDIEIDHDGNIIFCLSADDSYGLATPGAFQELNNGEGDALIGKLTPFGEIIWATYYGGSGGDDLNCVIVNPDNSLIFSGTSDSPENLSTDFAYQDTLNGDGDAILTKFSEEGMRLWTTYFGGPGPFYFTGFFDMVVDSIGNIFAVGDSEDTILPITPNAYQDFYSGDADGIIAKFDSSGILQFLTFYGGTEYDRIHALEFLNDTTLIIAGITASDSNIISPGAYDVICGEKDGLLASFSSGCRNPLASISPDVHLCKGDTVTISASGGVSYEWRSSTSLLVYDSSSALIFPIENELIICGITDSFGCTVYKSLRAYVQQSGNASEPDSVCSGDSIQVHATGAVNYNWEPAEYFSDPTSADPYVFPTETFLFFVYMSDSIGCFSSDSVFIIVNQLPEITGLSDTSICLGDTIQLNTSGGIAAEWSPTSGLSDPHVYDPFAFPTATIDYTLSIIDSLGCTNSESMSVIVFPLPDIPELYVSGDTIFCDATGSLQWYFNDIAIGSETNQFIIPQFSGIYSVEITDANGCNVFSDNYYYQYVLIANNFNLSISIFPNPADNLLNIYSGIPLYGYDLFTASGVKVENARMVAERITIKTSHLPEGLYTLLLLLDNKQKAVNIAITH
ncbi:MAG: hypothetical protein ACHQFW_11685, partial [Chitinophagales bacterium]